MKRAFAEHFVKLNNASAAARAAGYAHPHVKSAQLMRKEDGKLVDQALADEIRRLRNTPKIKPDAPPAPEDRPRAAERSPLTELETALKRNLLEIAMDPAETGSTRVAASNTLLKAIGKDRPADAVDRDEKAALKALRTLLGRTDD